jgi:NAD-dependent deacetylase
MTGLIPGELVERLRAASYIVAMTGAGISAESGVPTFRQIQTGLWAKYDPQELATPQAFQRDPCLVWEWYAWRRALVSQATPNPGHYALAQIEKLVKFTLITQNVDGLHQRAGSGTNGTLLELHGNIHRTKCFEENTVVENWDESDEAPPHCPHCGGLLRPDVVWFGEGLPAEQLEAAWQAAFDCDVFFSIGTSGLVEPAASLPYRALLTGAVVIEINPEETPLTASANFVLKGSAAQILPLLAQMVWPQLS